MTTQNVTLYQFELCPYCHKVRAGLNFISMKPPRLDAWYKPVSELRARNRA